LQGAPPQSEPASVRPVIIPHNKATVLCISKAKPAEHFQKKKKEEKEEEKGTSLIIESDPAACQPTILSIL